MAHFIIKAKDKAQHLSIRLKNRQAHRDYLQTPQDSVVLEFAGPILDDSGEMCGSLLVVKATTKEQVQTFLNGDPYAIAGLFQEVSIEPFLLAINRYDQKG